MNEYNYNRSNLRANDSEVTIDLVKVCRHLFVFENILLMVIAGILAGSISFLFSKYCLPELYTSSVAVYVSNNSSLVLTDGIDTQTITGSRNLAESYVVILKQDAVMDEVGNKLFEIYSEEELEEYFTLYISNSENVRIKNIGSYFTVEPIDETEVLKITVVTENPKLSADMCNILVDLAPDFLRGITGGGTVEAIGEAQVPENKSSPNNTKNALLGCFAGVFAVAGVLVLIIIMDNKIRDTESFKAKFEFPVFEEIPYIEEKETNKDNKRKKAPGKNSLF
ncbi:MAG: Wzz/FepE/Etk N-terminal domain-containing protein [Clostridiales bacterium]|nr:Wzz/FepE/Etk N-terminal domain-containing protein [Clostridiales bacterium]